MNDCGNLNKYIQKGANTGQRTHTHTNACTRRRRLYIDFISAVRKKLKGQFKAAQCYQAEHAPADSERLVLMGYFVSCTAVASSPLRCVLDQQLQLSETPPSISVYNIYTVMCTVRGIYLHGVQ